MRKPKTGHRLQEIVALVRATPGVTAYHLATHVLGGNVRGNYAAIARAKRQKLLTVGEDGGMYVAPEPLPAWDQSDGVQCRVCGEDATMCPHLPEPQP